MYDQPLSPGDVDLWFASLNLTDQVFDALSQALSSDEWERADQFAFERDQRIFIAGRGLLRDILAGYLDCQPGDIRFDYTPHGKPRLRRNEASLGLEFNLSHSSGFFVLAVSLGRRVGVDVERVKPLPDLDQTASSSFSENERIALSVLAPEDKTLGFFRCWTRKEAYLKARGDGLSIPLDSFDISLAPHNPIAMLANRLDPREVTRWSFYSFTPKPGFVGALTVEGQEVKPNFRQWKANEV